ncbi:hypothetical protein PHSY_002556 [Pseudozyma hubeiensis SY62]|uniref:Aminoglycoside phosphotransferase domain-containing protein n=1 Tax=Pseudozyma hubeiensis (strain SY62) TaxID=1305764 RepID=R9P135_PSEHS|nr:hypothetical protein PHSY_002556 [Pseudozyma hubeiensis SY62]GAC94983.1 hypothetical protein PHSY_002556 [Pseudozyma hubeiensis SY62]
MTQNKVGQQYGAVRHSINLDSLNAYLSSKVPAIKTPVSVKQFSFGQSNPTYILFAADSRKYVLRKKPPGSLLSSTAHAVEREYRILKALFEYTKGLPEDSRDRIPVPEVFCLCEEKEIVGTAFYVMEFIDGRIFEDYRFLQIADKEERRRCWMSAIDTLAALHRVNPAKIGLGDYGKPNGFYTRQMKSLGKVSSIQAEVKDDKTGEKVGALPRGIEFLEWFSRNMPADETGIVHGDYKIDNLIFHPTQPRVIGILDWELSTLGHPLSDLANLLQPYSTPCTIPERINDPSIWEESRRSGSLLLSLGNLTPDQSPVPVESDLIQRYCQGTNRKYPIERWTAAKAWAWFRLAVIAQGIAARNAKGQASSEQAKVYGSKFPMCAQNCFVVIEGDERGAKAKL